MKKRLFHSICIVLCLTILCTVFSAGAVDQSAQPNESPPAVEAFLPLDTLPDELLSSVQAHLQQESRLSATALDASSAESLTSFTTVNTDGSRTLFEYGRPVK